MYVRIGVFSLRICVADSHRVLATVYFEKRGVTYAIIYVAANIWAQLSRQSESFNGSCQGSHVERACSTG